MSQFHQDLVLKVSENQLGLLAAVHNSQDLKIRLIENSIEFAIGEIIKIQGAFYCIESFLGSGLIANVYKVSEIESNVKYALKIARANISFYRNVLQFEYEVVKLIHKEFSFLKVISCEKIEGIFLLKELSTCETLQELLFQNQIKQEQKDAFELVLKECDFLFRKYGILMDLSPKNIVWSINSWWLLDSGPKMNKSFLQNIYSQATWDSYYDYFSDNISTPHSQPYALSKKDDNLFLQANTYVFVKDLLAWFPLVNFKKQNFYVEINNTITQDDFILIANKIDNKYRITENCVNVHPFYRLLALVSWKNQVKFNPYPKELQFSSDELPLNDESDPLTFENFIYGIRNSKIKKQLTSHFPKQSPLPIPKLTTRDYKHWKNLLDGNMNYSTTDIFCHTPLPTEQNKIFIKPKLRRKLPLIEPFLFAEYSIYGNLNTRRVLILLPGFRATEKSGEPLIKCLFDEGFKDTVISVHIGIKKGDELTVSAGRWESIILWEMIEFCIYNLQFDKVDVLAASHGAIGGWIVAGMHPNIRNVILDSPLLYPMQLVAKIAKFRGESIVEVLKELSKAGFPTQNFKMHTNPPKNIRTLLMYPNKDSFVNFCGKLKVGKEVFYKGGHASTLRHDSYEKGIPEICIKEIMNFFKIRDFF